jgi:hypothetical protein
LPKEVDICTVVRMGRYTDNRFATPNGKKAVPEDLRGRLESARLDLRALYRALDRMLLAQDLPDELRRVQELDADFAEALWVLGQAPGRFDLVAMTRETFASLDQLADARERLLALFDRSTRAQIEDRAQATRRVLPAADAYLELPNGGVRGR